MIRSIVRQYFSPRLVRSFASETPLRGKLSDKVSEVAQKSKPDLPSTKRKGCEFLPLSGLSNEEINYLDTVVADRIKKFNEAITKAEERANKK